MLVIWQPEADIYFNLGNLSWGYLLKINEFKYICYNDGRLLFYNP